MSDTKPFRVLPLVTPQNEHFWRGGGRGELKILACDACGYFIHPAAPICPECLGRELTPQTVSGRAILATYTVNHQAWYPALDPPYVIAIVELIEQPGLRLTTNIYNCAPDAVEIGMEMRVVFDEYEDVWLPMFEPVDPDIRVEGAHVAPPIESKPAS
jgi:uncharacterized OB-fold protein